MLNAQFFGAGMNLQMATDIIMYHRFTKEMEEQIIGRAQRLGRSITEPLNVYYLLHENESDNIEDNFKFEDHSNTHYMDWLEQEKQEKIKLTESNKNYDKDNIIYTIDSENDTEKYDIDKFNLDFDNLDNINLKNTNVSIIANSNANLNLNLNTCDENLPSELLKINNDKIFIKKNEINAKKFIIDDDDDIINNFIKENNLNEIKKKESSKIILTSNVETSNINLSNTICNNEIEIEINENFDIDEFEVIN